MPHITHAELKHAMLAFCSYLCLRVKISRNHWVYFLPYIRLYGLSMEPFRKDLAPHDWSISSRWTCTLGLLRCAPSSATPPRTLTRAHTHRYRFHCHCGYFILTTDLWANLHMVSACREHIVQEARTKRFAQCETARWGCRGSRGGLTASPLSQINWTRCLDTCDRKASVPSKGIHRKSILHITLLCKEFTNQSSLNKAIYGCAL